MTSAKRALIPTLVLALGPVFLGIGLYAQDKASGKEEPKTELANHMGSANRAMRQLRNQIGDAAKNAESAQLVASIRESIQSAHALTPARLAEIPDADKARFTREYQAQIQKTVESLNSLEAALKAGDNAKAQTLMADVGGLQKEGHKQFKGK